MLTTSAYEAFVGVRKTYLVSIYLTSSTRLNLLAWETWLHG